MRKILSVVITLFLTFILVSCSAFNGKEQMIEKYCAEFPADTGCIVGSEPTGTTGNVEDDSTTIEPTTCGEGFYLENGRCVQEDADPVCEGTNVLFEGSCVPTCNLPIDDAKYYPCFREIGDEFITTNHKLVLTGDNSYFDSFTMWVQNTNMNNSSEFELHYTVDGETGVQVAKGTIWVWCSISEQCGEFNKAFYYVTQTTGNIKYEFSFEYAEDWYVKVVKITQDVWNEETSEYDTVDLGIPEFYLEDVHGTE